MLKRALERDARRAKKWGKVDVTNFKPERLASLPSFQIKREANKPGYTYLRRRDESIFARPWQKFSSQHLLSFTSDEPKQSDNIYEVDSRSDAKLRISLSI